jgi:serine beta-lactamase-like protein LACTB
VAVPKKQARKAIVLLLLLAAPALALEWAFENTFSRAGSRRAIEQSRELLRSALQLYPGTTVAVGIEDEIVWSAGFGFSDVRREIPVSAATQFRIDRVSEALTSVATVRLAEQGRLDLDAPVQQYVPAYPDKGFVITPRMLAAHLSGMSPTKPGAPPEPRRCTQVEDVIRTIRTRPLSRAPGSAYLHSSDGYVLLSAVLASASGRDFYDCIQDQVLRPSGMTATVLEDPRGPLSQRSRYYLRGWFGILREAPPADHLCKFGAAGFVSTAEDLVRFGLALLRGDLVRRETLAQMFAPQRTRSGASTGVGLGWEVAVDARGRLRLMQSGRTVGGRSAFVLVPNERLVVALLSNIEGEHLDDHGNRIASLFLDSE